MDLVEEAGFPPGVINMLPGTADAGHRLVTHPLVKKVSFTGGLATATKILTACADSAKPVVLELGGKSANIVLEDADHDPVRRSLADNRGVPRRGIRGVAGLDGTLAQTEVFGPVLAITRFSTDEEAVAIANSTQYGLSSYIQTNDITRAHRIAAELEAGEVLINGAPNLAVDRPFGALGISGVGKEGGRAGFEEFLRIKSVAISVK
jgi:aldehyde dehydrogenase (NAD+)